VRVGEVWLERRGEERREERRRELEVGLGFGLWFGNRWREGKGLTNGWS
jgi:hypothetical protein